MKNYIIATIAAMLIATVNTKAKPSTPPVVITAQDRAYDVYTVDGKLVVQNNTDGLVEMTITRKNGTEIYRGDIKANNKHTKRINLSEGKYNINLKGKAGAEQLQLQVL